MRFIAFRFGLIGLMFGAASCGGADQPSTPAQAPSDPPPSSMAAAGSAATDPTASASAGGAGMADGAASSCIGQYPPPTPFDVGDAPRPATAPEPGMPSEPGPVPTLAPIVEECVTARGSNCDAEPLVSKQAALCIARAHPRDGLESWSAEFRFDAYASGGRLEWFVVGSGKRGADGCTPAAVMDIDVTNGQVLSEMDTPLCLPPG